MTRSHYSVTFRSIETGNIEVSRFFSTVAAARKWAAFLSAKFSEVADLPRPAGRAAHRLTQRGPGDPAQCGSPVPSPDEGRENEMSAHTPGPWDAIFVRSNPSIIGGAGANTIATVEGRGSEVSANACLIAAAPELLRCLKEAIETCAGMDHDPDASVEDGDPIAEWRAAVAKATGEGR